MIGCSQERYENHHEPASVLRLAYDLFIAQHYEPMHKLLWQHDNVRAFILRHPGGTSVDEIIQVLGANNEQKRNLQMLLEERTDIPSMLPLLMKWCNSEPPSADNRHEAEVPNEVEDQLQEVLQLDEEAKVNPMASARVVALCEEILRSPAVRTERRFQVRVLTILGQALRCLPTGDPSIRLNRAIEVLRTAEQLAEPKEDPYLYALIQAGLGMTYRVLPTGDPLQNKLRSIQHFEEALKWFPVDVSVEDKAVVHGELGSAYLELPTLWNRSEHLANAIQHYIAVTEAPVSPLTYARALNGLAAAYFQLGTLDDLRRGLEACNKALDTAVIRDSPASYGVLMMNMAGIHAELARNEENSNDHNHHLREAEYSYKEALRVYTREEFPSMCAQVNGLLGDLYASQDYWPKAHATYCSAISAAEIMYIEEQDQTGRELYGAEEERKIALLTRLSSFYRLAAYAAARSGRTAEALLTLEIGRSRLLSEKLHESQQATNSVRAEWDELEKLISRSLTERQKSYVAAAAPPSRAEAAAQQIANLIGILPEQTEEHADTRHIMELFGYQVEKAGKAHIQADYREDPETIRKFKELMGTLLPDRSTALIAFCVTKHGSLAFLVYPGVSEKIKCVNIPGFTERDMRVLLLTPDVQGGWLRDYGTFRDEQTTASRRAWERTMTGVLQQLSDELLSPVLAQLPEEVSNLTIVPSGELAVLPLHAAPIDSEGSEYLCDRYTVNYVPSIRLLVSSYRKRTAATERSMYMIVNPRGDRKIALSEPAGARIAALFEPAAICPGKRATKAALIREAADYKYVHFFSHGHYEWDKPEGAYIELAGTDYLTVVDLEARKPNLTRTRLVTLAACDSGLMDLSREVPDEVMGISTSFLVAGTPCIISPLWSVELVSTVLLWDQFYQKHIVEGLEIPEALRAAQRWLRGLSNEDVSSYIEMHYLVGEYRNNETLLEIWLSHPRDSLRDPQGQPFEHPFFWAGFTVYGA